MKSLRILDKNLNLLAEIDNYESYKVVRRFTKVGEFELKINANKLHTDKLIKNNIVLLGKDYNKAGIILHREFIYGEEGENTDSLLIKGVTLQGIIGRRLIIPNTNEDFMSCEGNQETIVKEFVNKNCVKPSDPKRKIENLIIAIDKKLGSNDKWRGSYENLADKVQEICEFSNLGWNIDLDARNKNFIFDVLQGKDLSINQSLNPPVIFRSDFNNIRTRHFTNSIINHKNVVYVGIKEDSNKLVLSVGETHGFDRIESFSSNNSNDIEELKKQGSIQLKEFEELETFELQVNPLVTFIYEKDYNLGDIVTVQDRKLKITMNPQIVQIEEFYNVSGFQLNITFGKSIPTLMTTIKRMMK